MTPSTVLRLQFNSSSIVAKLCMASTPASWASRIPGLPTSKSQSFSADDRVTQSASDIVFQGTFLMAVSDALALARKADGLMRQNLGLALFYNLAAVPLAIMLLLGGLGLAAFLWALRSGQYDDLDGAASRILFDEDQPATATGPQISASGQLEMSRSGLNDLDQPPTAALLPLPVPPLPPKIMSPSHFEKPVQNVCRIGG